jgi:L-lysine 2,3-aminomutase
MDVGTHEMEINSFLLKFLSKGIKNSQRLDKIAHFDEDSPSIQTLYDISFNDVSDEFLQNIGLEDQNNPIWRIFYPNSNE